MRIYNPLGSSALQKEIPHAPTTEAVSDVVARVVIQRSRTFRDLFCETVQLTTCQTADGQQTDIGWAEEISSWCRRIGSKTEADSEEERKVDQSLNNPSTNLLLEKHIISITKSIAQTSPKNTNLKR